MKERNLSNKIKSLALNRKKMAFLSGPRQCGKTTLAKSLLTKPDLYYNWDSSKFKALWTNSPEQIAEAALNTRHPLIVLDEIHKNRKWKNQLKAFYDEHGENIEILLTGSAHLNVYRKGADSLMGRFVHFHLHPFSLGELEGREPLPFAQLLEALSTSNFSNSKSRSEEVENLFRWSGFPEPLFAQNQDIYNLWSQNRVELLVRQDLRDLSRLLDLSQVEILASLLPDKVGSPLSIQNLREDLDVAHTTISRWLDGLSLVYYHFELKPFAHKITRSLKKEGKIYLYDWSAIEDNDKRFENMVANHLLKMCHYYSDIGAAKLQLHYLRNKEKKEIDFLVVNGKKPLFTVEAKYHDLNLDTNYQHFQKQLKIPHFQVVRPSGIFRIMKSPTGQASVVSFDRFFAQLP